jgi:hypothetical protein
MIDFALSYMGVQTMTQIAQLIHALRGSGSKEEKASLAILRVIKSRGVIAVDLAISNTGNRAFSIIDMFFDQQGVRYHFEPVVEIESRDRLANGGGSFMLHSRMSEVEYENYSGTDSIFFESFNHKVFLQPGQSERGFVIFPVRLEDTIITKFGIVTSVDKETLITD